MNKNAIAELVDAWPAINSFNIVKVIVMLIDFSLNKHFDFFFCFRYQCMAWSVSDISQADVIDITDIGQCLLL